MIDLHSHILPGMDDGSPDAETSMQMLRQMAVQGVTSVCASSHYYTDENSVNQFCTRRQAAWAQLQAAGLGQHADQPTVLLAAEVAYFPCISECKDLPQLCIEGTRTLLLEMPFTAWNERMLYEVRELEDNLRCTVLIAHIERYLRFQRGQWFWHMLEEMRALIQSNASFFIGRLSRPRALRLLTADRIHLLGSDSHNLDTRPPNLGAACDIISRRLGAGAVRRIGERGENLLVHASERKDVFT